MKNDGLIVIGRLSYPSASAPSNRVHLYCKALKEAKGFPFVINLDSSFNNPQQFNFIDRFEGVPFLYCQKITVRENKFIKRNLKKIKGILNSFLVIKRLKKNHNVKVLFYSTNIVQEVIFFIFLKLMKISIIRDCSEAPLFVRQEKKPVIIFNFFFRLKLKMYNEIIVISDYLYQYYSIFFPKNKIFQIPILVDLNRFINIKKTRMNGKKVITYVGNIIEDKDGIDDLIEAMALINSKERNTQLDLVGSVSKQDLAILKNQIKTLRLNNVVYFVGSKNTDQIPLILANSDILVLARPNNNQAKAGFPTKLGEYLASGKPVVITKTGEIPKYLKDNVSAYLAEPDNVNNFAERVIFALNDLYSDKIGKNGFEVANKNFNYILYGKEIVKIINNAN